MHYTDTNPFFIATHPSFMNVFINIFRIEGKNRHEMNLNRLSPGALV